MKYIFILTSFFVYSFACSGDCMACHPVLKESIKNKYHQILTTCIVCHTKVPDSMTKCGGDCFSCHSQNKLIDSNRIEHQNLASCKECHINKEDIFKTKSIDNSNLMNILNNK